MSDCPHDYDEREASVYADGLCPICQRVEIEQLRDERAKLVAEVLKISGERERLHAQLTHAAGFCEGMAWRIEQHMLDKTMAAEDLREYAKTLRKLVGVVLEKDTTADPS